jgi:mono/diheme cytochrome c family protein
MSASEFFRDGSSARPLVDGTVARGQLRDDSFLYTGQLSGAWVDSFPFPITKEVLSRGQQRFNIFCSPCHGELGDGKGMIVQRGLRGPVSFHDKRFAGYPAGYFFSVITNGRGAMYPYGARVSVNDRWAIVAYIRALQLSQGASLADVPAADRQRLEAEGAP